MSKLFSLFFALIFVPILFAQDLPHVMTTEEKEMWRSYVHPVSYDDINPPPTPVRTMAEWEQLEGIAITWTSYTSILRQIVDYAQDEGLVYIICSDSNSVKSYLASGGVPLINLKFIIVSYNSIWIRDYGPWSVYSGTADSMKFIDWIYNRPRPLDDVIPGHIANFMNVPIYQTTVSPNDLVATGGNFMADGHGAGFSSKLILTENPGKTEAQIDTIMKKYMGLNRYIKMTTLPYDGIHHIDMHMKLLDEETILVGQYPAGVSDGPQIEANLQYILNNFQTCYGRPYRVVRIPMPPDQNGLYPSQGGVYRTFTNSVFVNKTIIIPIYDPQYDTTAYRIYREALPGYRVLGINSNAIIPSSGAIHCIVKEIGALEPVFISHPKLAGLIPQAPVEVKAFIKSRTGIANASLYWTADTSQGFSFVQMFQTAQDTFTAVIPVQPVGTKVFYYISANSNSGKNNRKPVTAPAGSYVFQFTDPVPAELVSFISTVEGNDVCLEWNTASEVNNKGFLVQRKQSGAEWRNVTFIRGMGTTAEENTYSYTDKNLQPGVYCYRLRQEDYDGSFSVSHEITAEVGPISFVLDQNHPNPFNPATKISYRLPFSGSGNLKTSLKIYDILGNEVAVLVNEQQGPGSYEYIWNAGDLPSGTYFCRLNAGSFSESRKMILLK